jgi:hypothetical protein
MDKREAAKKIIADIVYITMTRLHVLPQCWVSGTYNAMKPMLYFDFSWEG